MCLSPNLPVTNPPCHESGYPGVDMRLEGPPPIVPALSVAFSKNCSQHMTNRLR